MSAAVTVTGKAGPAQAVTAVVLSGITNVQFDTDKNILSLTDSSGVVKQIDINAAATITATKVTLTNTYTFAIS